mgnify:CR=1 FL=1
MGLNSMRERMGADLMVTPQNTKNQAEALLTGNSSSTFYFTNDIGSQIAEADGVGESTVQTYISSLAAACCDEKVQIIGFNPRHRLRHHSLGGFAIRRHTPSRPNHSRRQHQRVGQQYGQTVRS